MRDKIFEVWISALLSGPKTHMVNMSSNALVGFERGVPERAMAGMIDAVRAALTGTPQERFAGEAWAELYGLKRGLIDGVRIAGEVWETETPQFGMRQVERVPAVGGKTGQVIRTPLRALLAEDEFFKAVTYRTSLHALAYRQAAKEGRTGDARVERMVELAESPSPHLIEAARQEARLRTFTTEPGPVAKAVFQVRRAVPGLEFIVPFVNTPLNIVKYAFDRMGVGLVRGLVKGDLKGGELSEEVAKTAVGTMLFVGAVSLAASGYLTGGGPSDPRERAMLRATGWQPYAFRLPSADIDVGYGRLEPLGILMGLGGDAFETWETLDSDKRADILRRAHQVVAENLGNKTFLRGLKDASRAISDPERYGRWWLQGMAGTIVPTGVAQIAQVTEKTVRRPETPGQAILARIPGATRFVPEALDVWGRPIERTPLEQATRMLPTDISEVRGDKLDYETIRLGVRISRPRQVIGNVELSDEEYRWYLQEAGQEARRRAERIGVRPGYDLLRDERKADLLEDAIRDGYRTARGKIFRSIGSEERRQRREKRQKPPFPISGSRPVLEGAGR